MSLIKRLYFDEYTDGCLYHPRPGCVHVADEAMGKFVSSLVDAPYKPRPHAPALDIDFPTAVEKLQNGGSCLQIKIPWTTNHGLVRLLDALLRFQLISAADARQLEPKKNSKQRRKLPPLPLTVEAIAVPSSTPGHFHLYIEKEMSWDDYAHLLTVLSEAGIIGRDFYEMCMTWKVSFLLKPGFTKNDLKLKFANV